MVKNIFLACLVGASIFIVSNVRISSQMMPSNKSMHYEALKSVSACNQDNLCQEDQDIATNKRLEDLYQTRWGFFKRFFMKRPLISKIVGSFFDMCISKPYIKQFLKIYPEIAQHSDDFQLPIGGITEFSNFNNFFYRSLSQKGIQSHPIDKDQHVVTSPADGHLFVVKDLSKNPDFYVKGCKFNLEKFVGDATLAKRYHDGSLLLFRLAPNDYHRFHFPCDCIPGSCRIINGTLESVNPIAYTPTLFTDSGTGEQLYSSKMQPLTENERHVLMLSSPIFGEIICVIVGAMMVGQIHYTYRSDPKTHTVFKKGQEMGYFAFGGSTIVLIFKRNVIDIDDEYVKASSDNRIPTYNDVYKKYTLGKTVRYPESKVKMGQKVAFTR